MRYFPVTAVALRLPLALASLLALAACTASAPPPPAAPPLEGNKVLAMTQTGGDFAMLKEKPDGSLLLCFYSNWDDHRPLSPEGCASVPAQAEETPATATN